MKRFIYQKGICADLDKEWKQSQPFGHIRVGTEHLFWKRHFRWYGVSSEAITRAYRRVEEVNGKTGCCSNDFSIHHLILCLRDGQCLELLIGDSLYRHEPEHLIEAMKKNWPQLIYGKEKKSNV
ncbi:MAG: hypothetical protein MJ077_06575 [Oscillospiraceae bacterium]|nr:hypothetical protein [Oscillospiraceae bacterium]